MELTQHTKDALRLFNWCPPEDHDGIPRRCGGHGDPGTQPSHQPVRPNGDPGTRGGSDHHRPLAGVDATKTCGPAIL